MGTLSLQGSIVELPDGNVFGSLDLRVPLATPAARRPILLTADAPLVVGLDFTPIAVIGIESDFPVTVSLTSAAGTDQKIGVEFLYLISRRVPFTGITITRAAGQATLVQLTLGQGA